MVERFGELRVFRGVFFGVASNFGGRLGVVVVEEQRLAVGRGSEDSRIGSKNFAIEFVKLEVAGDVGAKRANGVRKSGSVEAGIKFLGDGSAADHFTPLENERFETTLRKIARGDERVVAATDKSYALSDGHDYFLLPEA